MANKVEILKAKLGQLRAEVRQVKSDLFFWKEKNKKNTGGCFFGSGFSQPVSQRSYLSYQNVDYSQRLKNDPIYRSISPSGGGAKKKTKKKLAKKYTSPKRRAPGIPAKTRKVGDVEEGRDGRDWVIVTRLRKGTRYRVWVPA
jgi:hypothetical protein